MVSQSDCTIVQTSPAVGLGPSQMSEIPEYSRYNASSFYFRMMKRQQIRRDEKSEKSTPHLAQQTAAESSKPTSSDRTVQVSRGDEFVAPLESTSSD